MIAPCGTFDYGVIVERDTDTRHRWLGRACTLRDSSIHPGMLGRRPLFALENGQVLLRSTESRLSILTNSHFRRWGPPVASASFEVGDWCGLKTLETAVEQIVRRERNQRACHRQLVRDVVVSRRVNSTVRSHTYATHAIPQTSNRPFADSIRCDSRLRLPRE
jgi:hypothetical protein